MSACVVVAGCSSGGPPRVRPPAISPASAGSGAIEQYDTNKNGVVAGEELDRAPALKAAIKNLDTSGDGGVSAGEVADRIKAWQASKVGKMSVGCVVTFKGRPVSEATVTFEPEKFLGTEIQPCSGITDESGVVNLSVALADQDDIPGAACGLYLVRISKQVNGKEVVPARYNAATTLGEEIALDAAGLQKGPIRFDLDAQ